MSSVNKRHIPSQLTTFASPVWFLFLFGFKMNVDFKWKDDHAPLVVDCMKGRGECLRNPKYEHRRNKAACENALQHILQELDFSELTVEDVN